MSKMATPGNVDNQMSTTDEKLLLHVCMFIALIIRTPRSIDKEWTAEEAKLAIDSSGMTNGSGLPPLDVPSVAKGLGQFKAALEQLFLLQYSNVKYSGSRVWKVKFSELNESAPLDCREAVEKCRQRFLCRDSRGKKMKTSQYECRTAEGLQALLAATENIALPPPPSSRSPPETKPDVTVPRFSKPFKDMKSEYRKRERAASIINQHISFGLFPHDLLDAEKYIERELERMGITREVVCDDGEEEEDPAVPDGVLSMAALHALGDEQLASVCYSRNDKVREQMESIEKKKATPFSRDQGDQVLKVYDGCLDELFRACDFEQLVDPVKARKNVMGMAAKATVSLVGMTLEFKSVTYQDVQRFVRNRNRRKHCKSKSGRQVNDAFEDAVLDKLIIVCLEEVGD
jgi:hypothetical protein